MKRTTIAFLGLLLVIAAVLVASLPFIGAKQVYTGQSAPDTNPSTFVPGAGQKSPLPTPTIPSDLNIGLAAYLFGKPELIHEEKGPIWIGDWLPDNRTILFTTYTEDENTNQFEEIKALLTSK